MAEEQGRTCCKTCCSLTYSLHCSSFLGLPFRILNIELVKPKKGTTMETIGRASWVSRARRSGVGV